MNKIVALVSLVMYSFSMNAQFFNHIDSLKMFSENPELNESRVLVISDHDSIPSDKKIKNLLLLKNTYLLVQNLIIYNSSIEEIDGMDSFIEASNIRVFNNGYLRSISGFENLLEFGRIEIYSNSNLEMINIKFSNLKDFDQIQISDNRALKSIEFNFNSIINDSADLADPNVSCNYYFLINNNDSLKEIKMETKDRFISFLNVYDNARLEKLYVNKFNYDYTNRLIEYDIKDYALGKVSFRSYLYIARNPMLKEFFGFDADSITLSHCYIKGNSQLNNLCNLQYYFNHFKFPNLDMKKYFIIDSNATGANSLAEVMNKNCTVSAIQDIDLKSIKILFPNPAIDHVELPSDKEIKSISCFNLLGKDFTKHIVKQNNTINIHHLMDGIYFINIDEEGNTRSCYKLIKKSK